MGNCGSDEKPKPVMHAPQQYQPVYSQPPHPGYAPGYGPPQHAPPHSQPPPPGSPYQPGGAPPAGYHPQPSPLPSQGSFHQPAPHGGYPPPYGQQPYPPQHSSPYPPQHSAPSPQPRVQLQPYSRSGSGHADGGSARMLSSSSGSQLSQAREQRVRTLRRNFPQLPADTIALVVQQTSDEVQQVATLSQMQAQADTLAASTGGGSRSSAIPRPQPLFRVGDVVDALFRMSWYAATIERVHEEVEGGVPVIKYTVKWQEDDTITLVSESELRVRQL
eukprot:TRINITY_DN3756_c1_g1_i1.p2 TRINITY_DN3756_c1_g1~~TRINITY_DN3756_c1_g1_i1.p2  ORF type:complete len:275 (+),score=90.63 TRINITY_DN3756_c1_g1_i1:78-902(+)